MILALRRAGPCVGGAGETDREGDMMYLVFDVESIGLHGEGFAFGFVIISEDGIEMVAEEHGCDPYRADGDLTDYAWVTANVTAPTDCASPREVRDLFWKHWDAAKDAGMTLVSDCLWPLEARFLEACIADDPARKGQG